MIISLCFLCCRYDLYSFQVIPNLGELIAGDRESYQYLVESVRRFPPQVQTFNLLLPLLKIWYTIYTIFRLVFLCFRDFAAWLLQDH